MFSNRQHINIRTIIRLLGLLLLIEAAFMLAPLAVCYVYDELEEAKSFIYSIAITAASGLAITLFVRTQNNDMGKREGFLITSLTWVVFSLFGMLPFVFGNTHMSVSDAFFETMSGLTTTGVSAITSVEDASHGILMWRAITHFIGGMGIILFTLAVLPMLNKQSGIQLFNAEVTGITHDKIRPRISHTAKSLWMIYLVLNAALIALLWAGPMNLFDAVCHSFATISTGGFSTKNASIAAYDSIYINGVITFFMFLSGVNFALIFKATHGNFKALYKNDTFRWYLTITLVVFVLILTTLYFASPNQEIGKLVSTILFQTVSAITSTGFSVSDLTAWHGIALLSICFVIFTGACAGSTTGSVKVDRVVLIFKNLKSEVYKTLHPNTIVPIRVNEKVVSNDVITKVVTFLLFFIIFIFIGTMLLLATDPQMSLFDSFFAVLSCLCNNGLGHGFTASSYAGISAVGKWILSFLMLVGRLEVFTVIILFTRTFWSKE